MCKPSRRNLHLINSYHLTSSATEQLTRQKLQWFGASPDSDVFRGQLNRQYVSVKRFRSYNNSENDRKMQLESVLRMWKEVATHPNIQPFLGLVNSHPILVTVHIDWNLMEYLRIRPQADKYIMAYYIASALEYMHGRDPPVLHGNLKASNVLVDQNNNIYASDIGISEVMYSKGRPVHGIRWRAPERILRGQSHTMACDVWSFGMTILEMYTGVHPFGNLPHEANVVLAMRLEETPQRPENNAALDSGLWAMLSCIWNYAPSERPTMTAILPWIRSLKEISRVAGLSRISSTHRD